MVELVAARLCELQFVSCFPRDGAVGSQEELGSDLAFSDESYVGKCLQRSVRIVHRRRIVEEIKKVYSLGSKRQ